MPLTIRDKLALWGAKFLLAGDVYAAAYLATHADWHWCPVLAGTSFGAGVLLLLASRGVCRER